MLTCPSCGQHVEDGTLVCPHCHAPIEVTQRISLSEALWCPGCGALLAPGTTTCPKCGTQVTPERPGRRARKLDLPEIGGDEDGTGRTGVMTRIESAIPPADDEGGRAAARDRIPRPRVFILAALLAVVVVGGATLLITHPWDPAATRTRASEPADTTFSGFPGTVQTLTGQDTEGADVTADEGTPLEQISAAHDQLGTLAEEVNESEDALRALVSGVVETDAAEGLADARQISIDVSNLISSASTLPDDNGTYAEDLDHLVTLANWLRNRCDALTEAWGEAAAASDVASVADSVTATLDAASDYRALFERNFDAWAPASDDAS